MPEAWNGDGMAGAMYPSATPENISRRNMTAFMSRTHSPKRTPCGSTGFTQHGLCSGVDDAAWWRPMPLKGRFAASSSGRVARSTDAGTPKDFLRSRICVSRLQPPYARSTDSSVSSKSSPAGTSHLLRPTTSVTTIRR